MKKLILYVLIFLLFNACSDSGTKKELIIKEEVNWVFLNNKSEGYKILHPDYKVEESEYDAFLDDIGDYHVHGYTIKTNKKDAENLAYSVNFTTYKKMALPVFKGEIRHLYKKTIMAKADGAKGKINHITFSNYKGIDMCEAMISMEYQPITIMVRLFVINQKQYELMVFTTNKNTFNKSTSKFLNSFELTDVTSDSVQTTN